MMSRHCKEGEVSLSIKGMEKQCLYNQPLLTFSPLIFGNCKFWHTTTQMVVGTPALT